MTEQVDESIAPEITVATAPDSQTDAGGTKRGGRFQPGQSGNRLGRPKGALNKTTLLRRELELNFCEELLEVMKKQALDGDRASQRELLSRMLARQKTEAIAFEIPEKISTPEALEEISETIFREVAAGNISPSQGHAAMSLLDKHKSNLVQSTKQPGSHASEAKAAEEVPEFDALKIAAEDYARATRTPVDPKPRGAADQKDAAQTVAK